MKSQRLHENINTSEEQDYVFTIFSKKFPDNVFIFFVRCVRFFGKKYEQRILMQCLSLDS